MAENGQDKRRGKPWVHPLLGHVNAMLNVQWVFDNDWLKVPRAHGIKSYELFTVVNRIKI